MVTFTREKIYPQKILKGQQIYEISTLLNIIMQIVLLNTNEVEII